jgi:hypothetical protein
MARAIALMRAELKRFEPVLNRGTISRVLGHSVAVDKSYDLILSEFGATVFSSPAARFGF